MVGHFRFPTFAGFLLGTGLLLSSPAARAQTAAQGYDFLTVTTVESSKSFILFTPAFQGKTEIALEGLATFNGDKYKERVMQNTQLINDQFSALTVAGWELVQTYVGTNYSAGRCYLFRKAKN